MPDARMPDTVSSQLAALFDGANVERWGVNTFHPLSERAFGVLLDPDNPPTPTAKLRRGDAVRTNLFDAVPVLWPHDDGHSVVLGWRITSRVKPSKFGFRFLACKRPGFPEKTLVDGMTETSTAVDGKRARSAVVNTMKKLPAPHITAALHGLHIIEVGDICGLVVVGTTKDLKI